MTTLTVGDIVNGANRLLRTENLPITTAEIIEYVREVVGDLTATEDILAEDFYIASNTSLRSYDLPPRVKYVLGLWVRQSDGSYKEYAPTNIRQTEDASIGLNRETYVVFGNNLVLQSFPPVSHTQGIWFRAITTHPDIANLDSLTDDTLLPQYYRRLATVMTAKRILESFLGDEAQGWIQALTQEEERLIAKLPKATGKYGGIGIDRFTYIAKGAKHIGGG